MNPDQFPVDQNRRIAQLERRIADLEAQVRNTKGTPIVRASGAFILPNSAAPEPGSGEVGFYSDSGEARWVDDNGQDYSLMMRPTGDPVTDPVNGLFNPPASYSQAHIQTIVNTVDGFLTSYGELLDSLRGNDTIAS